MNHGPHKNQHGFTLLEVLIALLILSIGLLGLAALQTVGLRSNQMATMRTQATLIAYDITDRMRANPTGVDAQEYVITTSQAPGDTSATGQALADLTEWRADVIRLPGGRSKIERTVNGTTSIHRVTVYWDEERKGITGEACGADPDIDLRCMQLTLL